MRFSRQSTVYRYNVYYSMAEAVIIDGKTLAQKLCDELASKILYLKDKQGIIPCLSVLLVGDDPASHIYVRNKIKKGRCNSINGQIG